LNYATYFAASDGRISCCGTGFEGQYWFDDGYADYSRNYSWAMGSVPEFAPQGQNHLLRSSSVVQKVRYSKQGIEYQTFDKVGTEVLRLTSRPARVLAGESVLTQRADLKDEGYTLEAISGGDYLVRVRHMQSNTVKIEAQQ
jgi:hypothetical protein